MITEKNILRHELIGLKARVIKATNPANIGLAGKIVDETYKTLVLENHAEKRIFKNTVWLEIELPNKKKVQVDGKLLVGRPWDRIKKKLPKW